ncbi:MAG: right-handed parallel beta-helix repeat-containing protein [bacterium]
MKRFGLIIISVAFLAVLPLSAATWKVGKSTLADFDSIQQAILDSSVQSGDTILVLPGVYVENVWFPANKNLVVRGVKGYKETIIQRPEMDSKGPQMTVLIRSRSVFEGFTVEDPKGVIWPLTTLESLPQPGGQILENTAGITVTGPATVKNNYVSGHRFGILQECPSGAMGIPPVIRFNIVEHNDIGIGCCETFSIFRDNIVTNNFWLGIFVGHSSCDEIVNNLVIGNGTLGRETSCGVFCWQSYTWRPYELNPKISANTIAANNGDGIICVYVEGAPNVPVIEHSIIAQNSGIGIHVVPADNENDTPRPRVYNCNIWGNAVADVKNVSRTINCISEDPLFVHGYRLDYLSPCIDRGALPENIGSTTIDNKPDKGKQDLGFHYPIPLMPGLLQ